MAHALMLSAASILWLSACGPSSRIPEVSQQMIEEEAEKQNELAFKDSMKDEERLNTVAFRLETANSEFCGKMVAARTGVILLDQDTVAKQFREVSQKLLGVGELPTVMSVVPGSPAGSAGLQPGDVITEINGEATRSGNDGLKQFRTAARSTGSGLLELTIEHKGSSQKVTMTPVNACSFPVTLMKSDAINAWTDGNSINVTKAMMSFAKTDDELALIVGHELGHCTMAHMRAKETNAMIGLVAGGIAGALLTGVTGVNMINTMANEGALIGMGAKSQGFETEADYVGTYYAARAGYDVTNAGDFWRRLASKHPDAIHAAALSSHPSTAARFVTLEETVKEIQKKQAAKESLIPSKEGTSASSPQQAENAQPAEATPPSQPAPASNVTSATPGQSPHPMVNPAP